MCIFSQSVDDVSGTRIFARGLEGGRQILVYSMTLSAEDDLAMILPLPVPPNTPEDAGRFVSLEDYPHFFNHLANGFPKQRSLEHEILLGQPVSNSVPLRVHDVGQFEASFVPTMADFGRLDARFRLRQEAWDQLPIYKDWGFAVFKLKGLTPSGSLEALKYFDEDQRGPLARMLMMSELMRRNDRSVLKRMFHPMAIEFPRRDPELLYFPTVHIHDGLVQPRAHFDHHLYCQPDADLVPELALPHGRDASETARWERSIHDASEFMDKDRLQGTMKLTEPVYRLVLQGELPNEDVAIRKSGKWTDGPRNRGGSESGDS